MFLTINANAKSHTHCQVARKAHRTSLNLSISMSLPTLTERQEKESTYPQQKLIRNVGFMLHMKYLALNKISNKLKKYSN